MGGWWQHSFAGAKARLRVVVFSGLKPTANPVEQATAKEEADSVASLRNDSQKCKGNDKG